MEMGIKQDLCYVDDLVRGLLLLMESDFIGPKSGNQRIKNNRTS